jgi:hypothetical protein
MLRGTTSTFSPLESPLVVSAMLPELTSERATLSQRHRTIGRAAIFGLARVSASAEATAFSENPWDDGDPGESLRRFVRARSDSLSYRTGSYDESTDDDESPDPRAAAPQRPRRRVESYEE